MENYENTQIDEMIEEEPEVEEEKSHNPLAPLVELYEKTVAEQDEQGFAEIYKVSTERFLSMLAAWLKKNEDIESFTPYDITYLDGYFIFGHGTNSVIHFYVKEAPGWKFGLWWKTKKKFESEEIDTDAINAEFFAQYEEEIDKFKPSASTFAEDFTWVLKETDDNWNALWWANKVVHLILTEPAIAWYREMHYANLNVYYISREDAQAEYTEYLLRKNAWKLLRPQLDQKMVDCVNIIFKGELADGEAFISDRGAGWSPRYDIVVRNDWDCKDGYYRFEDFEGFEEGTKLFNDTYDYCDKQAKEFGEFWSCPFHRGVEVVSEPKFTQWQKNFEEENDETN